MKLSIVPEKVIPARYEITFWEDRQHRDFVVSVGRADSLRDDLKAWLDANDPGWSVSFDRGDWGEGSARVVISLTSEAAARAFHARWNEGRCIEESAQSCSNMKRTSERNLSCDVCGEAFVIQRLDV